MSACDTLRDDVTDDSNPPDDVTDDATDVTVRATLGGGDTGRRFRRIRPHGLRKTVHSTAKGKRRREEEGRRFRENENLRKQLGHKQVSNPRSYDEDERLDDLQACRAVFDGCRVSPPLPRLRPQRG